MIFLEDVVLSQCKTTPGGGGLRRPTGASLRPISRREYGVKQIFTRGFL